MGDGQRTVQGFRAGISGGACAALIAARDWNGSPLGPLESWPGALAGTLGLVLASPVPMALLWGPHGILLYNDAYAALAGDGHPSLLGRPVPPAWPGAADNSAHVLRTVLAGQTLSYRDHAAVLQRGGRSGRAFLDIDYSPVAGEDGRPVAVLAVIAETTRRVASERRLQFRLMLERQLQGVDDPREVMRTAVDALGRHLGVPRVGYGCIQPDGQSMACEYAEDGRTRHEVFPLDSFGGECLEHLRRGGLAVCEDVATLDLPEEALRGWRALQARAFMAVPLLREGRLRATLFVMAHEARHWTPAERELVQDVANRTWDAVDRASAEQASRDSEARFRLLAELSPDALLINQDDRVVYANAAAARLYGVERPDDLIGCSPLSFVEGAEQLRASERLARLLAGEAAERAEQYIVRRDGTRVPVEVNAACVPWGAGHAVEVLLRDATERKTNEAALRELNETLELQVAERTAQLHANQTRMRAAFETSYIFQGLMAPDGTLLDANTTSLEAIGRQRSEVLGKPFWETPWISATPERIAGIRAAVARVANGEHFRREARVCLRGEWRWFDFSMRPIRNTAGAVLAIVPEAVETTERRRAEEALRQSQKLEAMGQLTGGVAHDFNNLLTPILGGLDMLQRRALGGPREQRLIEGALQSAERARMLVQRLLAFARRQPLQPRAVDLVRLVRGMAGLLGSTLGPQIRIRLELVDGLPAAHADANQLEMALLNLAVNARDAMPEGGELGIAVQQVQLGEGERAGLRPGRYLRLDVSDTGKGMDEATLARAIEPFFSTKGVGKGTGLGLSMVHGLASQLGGSLGLQSRPGQGTTAQLWLPVSKQRVAPDEPGKLPAPASTPAHAVLLVDDEETVRASTADMLADLGYTVVQSGSAEEALARLDAGLAVDMLVTDHLMPGMSGTDLARAVRSRYPRLPVLLVSGYAGMEGLAPGLPCLSKPFRNVDLAASLQALACP